MPGSGSGSGKRAGREAVTAPRLDSTNRLLRLPGAAVIDVSFGAEGVIVTVRLRRRRRVCSRCGQVGASIHDRYLTTVVDHGTGGIVWCSAGRNAQTLQAFFDQLGERKTSIRLVSIDMSGSYQQAVRENIPNAEIAFDPFHVVRLAQRAVDQVRRDEWNAHERSRTPAGKWIKGTR